MDFGDAVRAMKEGQRVRRAGWDGHVYLEDWLEGTLTFGPSEANARLQRRLEPALCMYTAQGKHQPGWVPSQADMLAKDWQIVSGG
jgi:hypothetical protein